MKKMLSFFLFILTLSFLGLSTYLYSKVNQSYNGKDVFITIPAGSSFSKINGLLKRKGIIKDASFFYRYVKFKNKLNSFQAGTFAITSGMDVGDILLKLTQGRPILNSVTIPEGKNLYQIARILERNNLAREQKFIAVAKNSDLAKSLGIEGKTLEGYLYPETYKFAPGIGEKKIAIHMVNLFRERTKNLDFKKSKLSKQEVITLASIVEKETGAPWERSIIAGVYLNRLKKGMRLQADPTTIYGIWEKFDGNLRRKHLLQKTAYNTYKMSGLPAGPIANPSQAAIKAVLSPKQHNFLYFVSKNDGTHIFTPTYKMHQAAVKKFQLNSQNREGKSWRDLKKKK